MHEIQVGETLIQVTGESSGVDLGLVSVLIVLNEIEVIIVNFGHFTGTSKGILLFRQSYLENIV